jgi:hypothetical protein
MRSMSPSRSRLDGSPTRHQSIFSPRASSRSMTALVPSFAGPSSSLVMRKAIEPARAGMAGQVLLAGHHHGREAGLHVGRAAAPQLAVALGGNEGLRAPGLHRAGRHHVGVAREAEQGTLAPQPRPEIIDLADAHALDAKTQRLEPPDHQFLAVGVIRGDGGARDQRLS